MTDEQARERAAIEKFLALIDKGDIAIFSRDEAAVLQRFAKALLGLEAMGRLAALAKSIITYVGWAVAVWLAFKGGFFEWLKSGLGIAGRG